MTGPAAFSAVDPLLGEISWRLDDGHLRLTGAGVPVVELTKTNAAEPLAYIPIGTRERSGLSMSVGGRPVDLRPGKGRMSRRSYRILAITDDGPLLFAASSPTTSRLVRGEKYRGDNELGIFERREDGSVEVQWSEDSTAFGVTAKGLQPSPSEAALGYALAIGFGTGAKFFLAACASAIGDLFP